MMCKSIIACGIIVSRPPVKHLLQTLSDQCQWMSSKRFYPKNYWRATYQWVSTAQAILVSNISTRFASILVSANSLIHLAHLNLREPYLEYKHLIAEVLVDKNSSIRTVINKIDNVGDENEFRTFSYEVLAGPDDMLVEVSEASCVFKFDYSKVYWNTKLGTEHQRLDALFQPGEVVADIMAGVGPFAVPAGKKGVFVWANDKNPESYKYLNEAIKRNKV